MHSASQYRSALSDYAKQMPAYVCNVCSVCSVLAVIFPPLHSPHFTRSFGDQCNPHIVCHIIQYVMLYLFGGYHLQPFPSGASGPSPPLIIATRLSKLQ